MYLSAAGDKPRNINPFTFQQVCGTMLTGDGDDPMNGETQGDAHEFLTKLVDQVEKEQPGTSIDGLLAAQSLEQQVCECGTTKTFIEENSNFSLPQGILSREVPLASLFTSYFQDESKFKDYRCEKCGDSGKWSAKDGWKGKRMMNSPEYFIANVPRGQIEMRGNRMHNVKLMTKIGQPLKKIPIPSADGTRVHYHMVAMIRHTGQT